LRDLDVGQLRSRWHNGFGRRPHPQLPRHLLFRVLAYRLQADVLGDLDGESQHLLDRSVSPKDPGQCAVELARHTAPLAFDVNADEPQQRRDHQWRPFIKPMSMPIPKAPLTTPNGWRRAPASIWEIRVFHSAIRSITSAARASR
jgi:hypothetical protein